MNYISFNIRSVREFATAGGEAVLTTIIKEQNPTVLFLQETHLAPEDIATTAIADWIKPLGWHIAAANSLNRRSSGIVALSSSTTNTKFQTVFDTKTYPLFPGRVIEYEAPGNIIIMNVYGLHSGMKLEKLTIRTTEWDVQLRNRIAEHRAAGKKVMIFGDLNVAPESIDLANPRSNTRRAGFTREERESWKTTQTVTMLIDAYRLHHADKEGRYSFWTSRVPTARPNNIGWRLDTAWCSVDMKDAVVACDILTFVTGSDHAPLKITLK